MSNPTEEMVEIRVEISMSGYVPVMVPKSKVRQIVEHIDENAPLHDSDLGPVEDYIDRTELVNHLELEVESVDVDKRLDKELLGGSEDDDDGPDGDDDEA